MENVLQRLGVGYPEHVLLRGCWLLNIKEELHAWDSEGTHSEGSLHAHDATILFLPLEVGLSRLLLEELGQVSCIVSCQHGSAASGIPLTQPKRRRLWPGNVIQRRPRQQSIDNVKQTNDPKDRCELPGHHCGYGGDDEKAVEVPTRRVLYIRGRERENWRGPVQSLAATPS